MDNNNESSDEDVKIPTYAKIDEEVKRRATMYVTKSKLMDKKTRTMNVLIEESLDQYMINNPL